jgi:sigma-B regulation protein RsbU (phosphoserine phosphatase)
MIHQHGDLSKSITKLNEFLVEDTPEGSFISLLAARLDPVSHTMQYVGAGHDAWIFRADGQVLHLPSTGLLLGLMTESHYECSDEIPLHQGDLLLMITDGLQEALSRTGELFGTDRLLQIVLQNREREPADLIEHLIEELRLYVDHRPLLDDVTILAAKVDR